jgi:hypothetical protein
LHGLIPFDPNGSAIGCVTDGQLVIGVLAQQELKRFLISH